MSNEPIIHGATGYVLRSRLPSYSAGGGESVTETWQGLYSARQAKYDELKAAGAVSISTSVAGATCVITAVFGSPAGAAGGGSGGGGGVAQPVTIRWTLDPMVAEIDLKRIRTWGPDGDPLEAGNIARAEALNNAESLVTQGKLAELVADTGLNAIYKKYAAIYASGITGAMRAHYSLNKTTTWAKRADIKGYVDYAKQFTVVSWANTGAPADLDEPKYRDVGQDGIWYTAAMEWLTMPPRIEFVGRSWSLSEQWLGAIKWKGELYDGGTG